ncbi:redox-sensitive transcriptional activator SoxR [Terracoccus luteus]|uniref:MerR family redox-sensitive transcriptional activator SoxR n=1 Tax=Terracoccus luteus TaxID=53356 RepID=A0A839PTB2_9MICO|nr:redox-sensitive transcriptional activator SoxR [Terracoccus luteus]MBB2986293.1 MerR family redox-sensitive transcriptional activator SoxR [Terracoccus luteus]MCP2172117.1 MerR family redox-sensitive transcriptional activator SoxR [Terracoccus luteus]
MPPTLTIGEVAHRTGVAASALRYWEQLGLIHSERTGGNQRRYDRATIRRVSFVRAAQRVGLSLDEVAAALDTLPAGRTPTARDWARLSRSWRGRLDDQIVRLERLRDQLDSCIGCGCLSLATCVLHNPDDVLAEKGRGAVLLDPEV